MLRSHATLIALCLGATLAVGCGGAMLPPPTPLQWASGSAIRVESVGATSEQSFEHVPELQAALERDLAAAGFAIDRTPKSSAPVVNITALKRYGGAAALKVNGQVVANFEARADSCMSEAWGVMGEHNTQCISRALVGVMSNSPVFRAALGGGSVDAASAAVGSAKGTAPGGAAVGGAAGAACQRDLDCSGDLLCEGGRCVAR